MTPSPTDGPTNYFSDDVVHVWWFDRQGAIQSHGINFVQNLPHFLVLLLAFQRMSQEDWGINTHLRRLDASGCLHFSLPESSPVNVVINPDDVVYRQFSLQGRGTTVVGADKKRVVKVSWPEATRTNEAAIIKRALEGKSPHTRGHLPEFFCSYDFDEFSTSLIRGDLGIEYEKRGARTLRILLFNRLSPITKLTGEAFWKAFWECYYCEFALFHSISRHCY